MASINKFEDLEIGQVFRIQTNDIDRLLETTSLAKDFEFRNQMNAPSGSVMDCITQSLEISGVINLKTFPNNRQPDSNRVQTPNTEP